MSEESPKANSEHQPLTVAHGRRLYKQSLEISQQVAQLAPLLDLLNPHSSEEEDMIDLILKHFETLVNFLQHQGKTLADIDTKVSALIANSNIEMP